LKVGAAERLAGLALGADRLADGGQVDRSEAADEACISRAQSDLRRSPGLVVGLGAQNLAHRVAHSDQSADDPGVLCRYAFGSFALADRDRPRRPVNDLDERAFMDEIAALLDGRAL